MLAKTLFRHVFFAVLLSALTSLLLSAQTSQPTDNASKSVPQATLVLEVMNWHFTVDRRFPSVYLRVFSDGSVECHAMEYDGTQQDVVKKSALTPDQFAQLRQSIAETNLRDVETRYRLTTMVFDSWMEWDINIPRPNRVQKVEVPYRSASFPLTTENAYPRALLELGCSIWKIRNDVFGDAPPYAGCGK